MKQRLVMTGKKYSTSCCATLRSLTSNLSIHVSMYFWLCAMLRLEESAYVFKPDSVLPLTARKKASMAERFPRE